MTARVARSNSWGTEIVDGGTPWNLHGNGALVLAANQPDAPFTISSSASGTPFSTPADGTDPCTGSLPPWSVIASLNLQEPR